MKKETSPFRHRERLDAQSLINCKMDECIQIEALVDKSLELGER